MLSRLERALTDAERGELSVQLERARRESGLALVKAGGASVAVCGVLAVLTLLASDAPRLVIAAFWLGMTGLFTAWIGWPWRKLMRGQIPILESALETNRAAETRIQSSRVVEFEEVEDEGACYAFALDDTTSVFIVGQEFYEDDDFPNTDFAMVDLLGPGGTPVTTLLRKAGRKLQPERVVSAKVKDELEIPEHLEIVPVPLEHLERDMTRRA